MFKSFRKKLNNYKKYSDNKEYYDQLEVYLKSRCLLPSLHIVKQNNIHEYRQKFNIQLLVETGTFKGDMVEAQKAHFKKIYSIELGDELYINAVQRFQNDKNVSILQGDSALVLNDILKEIAEPTLFWLDGHYSAGITAKADKNTPILAELEQILNHLDSHVILIDDARLFTGTDDYPTIPDLCSFILSITPDKRIQIADDIIRITPNG